MSRELIIQADAENDIADAFGWYEGKSKGLGFEFLREMDCTLLFIQREPFAYSKIYKNLRRCLLRKFPYGILYFVLLKKIVVIGCFHGKRNPKIWRNRI